MAKKKKDTTTAFSIQGFDMTHYRRTEAYTTAIENLYAKATTEISNAVASGTYDPDKPFAFSDYPRIASYVKQVMTKLASNVQAVISEGSRREWLFACRKNDEFIKSIMDTAKLTKKRLEKMQDRNLDALKSFQTRKVEGLDLSQRVWKYTDQYRAQLELGLDVGLGEGRSAQQLARDVKQNLKYPDKLFRRVRDKRGNLQLSKAAKAFHPGTGVYRSSVKNAQRLTRSEINMAYRESDYLRWQQLDFVVGFDVHRSNHEPLCKCDLCAQLVGRYPKTFKFKGWHPQCMCYATPVLMDDDTFDANELGDLKAALRGKSYRHLEAKNAVTDVPDGFKEWVENHKEQQQGWKSVPYFIRDNFVDGNLSKGLKSSVMGVPADNPVAQPKFEAKTPQEAIDFIIANIADGCTLPIKKKDLPVVNQIINQVVERMKQFGIPRFKNVGVPSRSKALASWTEFNELNFNLSVKPETIFKQEMRYRERMKLKYGRDSKYSDYTSIDDVTRSIVDHELGHCLYWRYGMKMSTMNAFGKAMISRNRFNEVYDVLGYYASTEEQEYFAEAFAKWMGGSRDEVVGYTKGLMEELMAKVEAKVGANPIAVAKPKTIMQDIAVTVPKNPAVKYVLDDPAMTYEDRAKNYVDIISAMYGSKGNYPGAAYKTFFDRVKSQYADFVVLKKTFSSPDRYLDMNIIKPVNINIGYGIGEHFDAVRHLGELSSAKDLDKIPSMWRSRFNECIKKIDALDAKTDGYVTVYREIEEAYNIYKLSTNKAAVEYGLEKISPKMPAGLFDIAKKIGYNLADHMPKKDFFDSLDKYVPLSLKGMKEETCYYSPTFKFVRLPINIADVKDRFESKVYRTKIVYHEFGHARADMSDTEKWENSKEWNDLFDKYEAIISKRTAAEYTEALNDKASALKKDGKLSKDDANSLGALSDTIQALVKDHGYVWKWGHSPSYFSKRDNQLAEFIAHASENYWGGNALFKELSPDLYKDMCELVKKMGGKRTGAGQTGTTTTSPSSDRKEDSMESVRSQRRELLVRAQKLVNQTITVSALKRPVLITKTSVKEWLNQPHRHLQEKNAMIMDIAGILKKSRYVGAVPDKHDSRVTAHLFETVVGEEKSYIIVRELGNGEFRLHSISDSSKLAELAKKKK